ncbi:MAG: DUF4178 domain-containing protein [Thermomicrobiales bacterium]
MTYRDANYTVIGRITIETASESWRDFQLRGGDSRSWLRVPAAAGGAFLWCRRVEQEGKAGDAEVTVDGTSYRLASSLEGNAEVIGTGGGSGNRDVTIHTYSQFAGSGTLSVYHWRADEISLLGEPIDAAELELWSREGGEAI